MGQVASGPLAGVKIVELAGIGPGPYAAMLLADMGADVVRVERPAAQESARGTVETQLLNRGRRSVVLDLRKPEAVEALLAMVERADALLEGYRPGVTERLGFGPDVCLARNPRLVYGRMTGWGQDGPLALTAGHDIGYIAITGALHGIGPADGPPVFPQNLLGDFGGGTMFLIMGVLAALLEARSSGQGQVVDAAIVDGTASLMTMVWSAFEGGWWQDRRGVNLLDGGAPYYDVYATADGGWLAVGSLEPQFFAALVQGLGLDPEAAQAERDDPQRWPELRARIAAAVKTRTRDAWAEHFAATDACVAPILSMSEAPRHPHLAARGTYVDVGGVTQPAPAPRFSRTPGAIQRPPSARGTHTREALEDWGVPDVAALLASGAAVQA